MDADVEVLAALERHLRQAEADLQEREQRALTGDVPPEVLLALSAERDQIALERDGIADVLDEMASGRDRTALDRDVVGSGRDRNARVLHQDRDPGWGDRFASGADRDLAAGDRGDSFDDRRRAHEARQRAAADREQSAADRDAAAVEARQQTVALDHLRLALESRLVIGQAEGLLMAQHKLSPEAAFQVLVRLSRERNVKLRDVALSFVQRTTRSERAEGGSGPPVVP